MTFEELRQTWQSQQSSIKLTLDSDLLFKEVKRNYRHFEVDIHKRDLREVGAGILCALFFATIGIPLNTWIFMIMVPCCIYVSLFFVIDRKIQKGRQGKPSESLGSCIRASLQQLDHQIWLVNNLVVLYLLPFGLSFTAVFACMLWQVAHDGCRVVWVWTFLAGCIVFVVCVLIAIYRANQKWLREELLPRRQELEQLLRSIQDGDE